MKLFTALNPINTLTDTLVARQAGSIPVRRVVAADLSANGKEVINKNYGHIYYWNTLPGLLLDDLLKKKQMKVRYPHEPQGEAMA